MAHVVDLVVDVRPAHVSSLLAAFPSPRYYLSESAIRQAIDSETMFNLLDTVEGDKVDFWVLTAEPFDRSRFARKHTEHLLGAELCPGEGKINPLTATYRVLGDHQLEIADDSGNVTLVYTQIEYGTTE